MLTQLEKVAREPATTMMAQEDALVRRRRASPILKVGSVMDEPQRPLRPTPLLWALIVVALVLAAAAIAIAM